jgi:murein DD-endopeptidase MepM/ murein hydrolase activator NlpD
MKYKHRLSPEKQNNPGVDFLQLLVARKRFPKTRRTLMRFVWSILISSLGLLVACQAIIQPETRFGAGVQPQVQATVTTEEMSQDLLEASPTAILGDPEALSVPPSDPILGQPTPASDPLRFVFPTPGPVAVSAWRPPLYEVPWALSPYDHFYFIRPIAADEVNWPLADYRYGGKFFANIVHTGVDIPAPEGTPVIAAGPGKVLSAGYGVYSGVNDPEDPYGLAIVIRHDFGYQGQTLYTVYGHLSQIDVAIGQHVQTGEYLGLVGRTGFTTGPHLHFEVRIGENRFFTTRNPELWVAPPLGWGVLAGQVMNNIGQSLNGKEIYVVNKETGQTWTVISYGSEVARSDPYYDENLVLGDLPAGRYEIRIPFLGILYKQDIEIKPGVVNYFTFMGRRDFGPMSPPTPENEFTPDPLP